MRPARRAAQARARAPTRAARSFPSAEFSRKHFGIPEPNPRGVFGRQRGRARERPIDMELRIVPENAALVLRRVKICRLVEHFGEFAQHAEPVRETYRYPEQPVRFGTYADAFPSTEPRRAAPDIHRHIENLPGDDADELALRPADLVVQPAQHALLRARVIVLNEVRTDSRALELPLVPAFEEESARVAEHSGLKEEHIGESCRNDLHAARGPAPSRSSESR